MKALLLDALGTLVELPPPGPALREELRVRFGLEVTAQQAELAIAAEIAYYRPRFDRARDADALRELRRDCAEVLRQALPASPALAAVERDALVDALLGALRFRAYDDAVPAIRAARARGLRVVVASNWDVGLGEVLARIGIAPLLDGIVTSASAGARKPAAAVFQAALRIAGVAPADAVHVGDSLVEDVDGARAAGLRPVLIARGDRSGLPAAAENRRQAILEADRRQAISPDLPIVTSLSELSALT